MSDWRDDFQITIDSFPDDLARGAGACERLLSRTDLPPEVEEATRKNSTWYMPKLSATGSDGFREPPYLRSVEITQPETPPGWSRLNPSIAASPEGKLRVIVRTANYRITPTGHYDIVDQSGDQWTIRTENYVGTVWGDLSVQNVVAIDDRAVPRVPTQVVGLEDCRLFWFDGGWNISATARDLAPDMVARIVTARLEDGELSEVRILSDGRRHEKNWMPIIGSNIESCPEFLYQTSPTMTFSEVFGGGTWGMGPWILRHCRGGSQLVPVRKRSWLALVHESVNFDGRRVYMHRFVEFGPWYAISRLSHPFCFEGRGVEFAAGMVLTGDDLVISYGVNDGKAALLRMPVSEALAMLYEPDVLT